MLPLFKCHLPDRDSRISLEEKQNQARAGGLVLQSIYIYIYIFPPPPKGGLQNYIVFIFFSWTSNGFQFLGSRVDPKQKMKKQVFNMYLLFSFIIILLFLFYQSVPNSLSILNITCQWISCQLIALHHIHKPPERCSLCFAHSI